MDPSAGIVIPLTMPVAARLRLYERMAREGMGDPWVRATAGRIVRETMGRGRFARALAVLRAVQDVPYIPDPPGPDRVHSAEWTARHGGDCEDKSILFVATATASGVPAAMVWLDPERSDLPQAHLGTRADYGPPIGWSWAEVSVRAEPGEYPYDAAVRLGLLRRITG